MPLRHSDVGPSSPAITTSIQLILIIQRQPLVHVEVPLCETLLCAEVFITYSAANTRLTSVTMVSRWVCRVNTSVCKAAILSTIILFCIYTSAPCDQRVRSRILECLLLRHALSYRLLLRCEFGISLHICLKWKHLNKYKELFYVPDNI